MKTVLGIDTSTSRASVAVVRGSAESVHVLARGESGDNTHSQRLLGLIDEALGQAGVALAEVDGIAIGAGPGSFTGLRIGMATAKGLAFAAGKPLWAVSSLGALALEAAPGEAAPGEAALAALIVPVLDARRGEIFVGYYRAEAGAVVAVADEQVMPPEALGDAVRGVLEASGLGRAVALGDGMTRYRPVLDSALVASVPAGAPERPAAAAVAELSLHGEPPDVLVAGAPVYIRLAEAEIKFPDGNPGGTFAAPR